MLLRIAPRHAVTLTSVAACCISLTPSVTALLMLDKLLHMLLLTATAGTIYRSSCWLQAEANMRDRSYGRFSHQCINHNSTPSSRNQPHACHPPRKSTAALTHLNATGNSSGAPTSECRQADGYTCVITPRPTQDRWSHRVHDALITPSGRCWVSLDLVLWSTRVQSGHRPHPEGAFLYA
jgi:hypothetical protein